MKNETRVPRFRRQRRVLSCLPCREHKLKCDRRAPCEACSRHGRESRCQQHPSSAIHSLIRRPSIVASTTRNSNEGQERHRSPSLGDGSHSQVITDRTILVEERASSRNSASRTAPLSSLPKSGPRQTLKWQGEDSPLQMSFIPLAFDILEITKRRHLKITDIDDWTGTKFSSNGDPKEHWQVLLSGMLPKRAFCTILIEFFFGNLNWIYRSIHVPSFMDEYESFWSKEVHEIELHWLALLFSLISSSAMSLTATICTAHGVKPRDVRQSGHRWYSASRQALIAGDWEAKPSLEALQAIMNLQHYLYATKKIETLNVYVNVEFCPLFLEN